MLMKLFTTVLFFIFVASFSSFAQTKQIDKDLELALESNLKAYHLKQVQTAKLYNKLKDPSKFHKISLELAGETFDLELWDSGLRSPNHRLRLASGAKQEGPAPLPLKGYANGDPSSNVRLTINHGFLSGYVRINGKTITIQPAQNYMRTAAEDLYVSYYDTDAIDEGDHKCGGVHNAIREKIPTPHNNPTVASRMGMCYETEIALAADYSMVLEFGSTNNVENQMEAVLNDVQGDFDDSFADEILYEHVDTYISDCSTCDPWTSSNNAGALLDDFTDWAPSNLGFHDVASLWTNRNFNGSTIGIAWLGAVCTNASYNVLENFTNSSSFLRVLQSHELGHNWDAGHDGGGGFIMSASINNTSTWSNASINDIEDYYTDVNCLDDCTQGFPPEADFDYDIIDPCTPGVVEFTDESEGATSWFWTFEGGTPQTSTAQDPVVVYNVLGDYDVTLEVTNAFGTDEIEMEDIIEILTQPIADFDFEGSELFYEFFEETFAGPDADFFWEFGDGQNATGPNPTHFYSEPGTYEVTLEVENECDDDDITIEIEVYDEPEVSFTVDSQTGCVGSTFQFEDTSYGNIQQWNWSFPGGTPSSSSQPNPEVTYSTPGSYDVSLEVINQDGDDDVLLVNYITVVSAPTAAFTFTTSANTVSFTNNTQGAIDNVWDFGDGNTSTAVSPVHVYAGSGDYTVVLTTANSCGTTQTTQTVSIQLEPTAAFSTVQAPQGCADYTINYVDNSTSNPTSWNWSFPGGTPATSTLQNPVVTYTTKGVYDVTLVAGNSFGSNTKVEVDYVVIDELPQLTPIFSSNLLSVNFSSQAVNADSISWNFGDGNTSNLTSPTHTYATEGNYNVTVTATSSCGTVTENLAVSLTLVPTAAFTVNSTTGCAPYTAQFTDNSSSNVTSWNWTFPGGNPASSTLQNPTVSYDNLGSYDVTLVVSNSAGSSTSSQAGYIVVNDVPELSASFAIDILEVSFSSDFSNADNITWDFGDGNRSTDPNPVHTYAAEGSYRVIVAASNGCGTTSQELTITLTQLPFSNFTADVTQGCSGLVVNYRDNSSSNTTSWNWTFPGGTPASSTDQNPTVTYNSVGVFDASLTASNSSGSNTFSSEDLIQILDVPVPMFTQNLEGNVLFLTNTTPLSTVVWTTSDGGMSTNPSWSYAFRENGTFRVTMEVTNMCGTSTEEFDIRVTALPTSAFTVVQGVNDVNCIPQTIQFQNNSTEATSYQWQFPGGTPASSTDENPEVVYNQIGEFDVSLTVFNQFGSDIIEQNDAITVTDVPVVNFESSASGSVVSFTNTSMRGESYDWDFGDGNSSTLENPDHSYQLSDSYVVTLNVTNACGTTTFSRVVVVDFSVPGIDAQFTPESGCLPLEVQITDMSTNDPTSWQWDFPQGTPSSSTEQNPVVVYDQPGVYSVFATISNADGTSTFEFLEVVEVSDVPDGVNYTASVEGDTLTIENQVVAGVDYSWDFGDGGTSTEPSPIYIYDEPGIYTITLIATNECGSIEETQTVEIIETIVATQEINEVFGDWKLAPNPSRGEVTVIFEENLTDNLGYQIFDLLGQSIEQGEIKTGNRQKDLVIETNGVYLIVLSKGDQVDVRRLTVID